MEENRKIIVHENTLKGIINDLNIDINRDPDASYSEYCRGLRDAYMAILNLLE